MTASVSTHNQDAADRRDAARALLTTPIVTAAQAPDALALIRRHAPALRNMFATQLGYQLTVESSFARLTKPPLTAGSPERALLGRNGSPFGAAHYALLALTCAALLAPGIGEQVLVSSLVAQIRSDAAEQGITVTDHISDRRRLVAAIGVLLDLGVVTETDGSVAQWGDGTADEALLTISRPLLPHLLSRTIGPHAGPTGLLVAEADQPRRHLRRRLVEDPVVLRADMSPEELDVLSRERSELTRHLDENFGLTLEVRAEGALAYDIEGSMTDIAFPGPGSLKQAALLLLGEVVNRADGAPAGLSVSWPDVDAILGELAERHTRAWKSDYTGSVDVLRSDVVALLAALGIASADDTGVTISPVAARYRPREERGS